MPVKWEVYSLVKCASFSSQLAVVLKNQRETNVFVGDLLTLDSKFAPFINYAKIKNKSKSKNKNTNKTKNNNKQTNKNPQTLFLPLKSFLSSAPASVSSIIILTDFVMAGKVPASRINFFLTSWFHLQKR